MWPSWPGQGVGTRVVTVPLRSLARWILFLRILRARKTRGLIYCYARLVTWQFANRLSSFFPFYVKPVFTRSRDSHRLKLKIQKKVSTWFVFDIFSIFLSTVAIYLCPSFASRCKSGVRATTEPVRKFSLSKGKNLSCLWLM